MDNKEEKVLVKEFVKAFIDKALDEFRDDELNELITDEDFTGSMGEAIGKFLKEFEEKGFDKPEVTDEFMQMYFGICLIPVLWADYKIKQIDPSKSITDSLGGMLNEKEEKDICEES